MQFDWSIAVQDQVILHEELKCLRGILKMSLFHCSYFIKNYQMIVLFVETPRKLIN
jgi:hypothetical protein